MVDAVADDGVDQRRVRADPAARADRASRRAGRCPARSTVSWPIATPRRSSVEPGRRSSRRRACARRGCGAGRSRGRRARSTRSLTPSSERSGRRRPRATTRRRRRAQQRQHVGQVALALGVVGRRRCGSASLQRRAVEDVDAGVDLADRELARRVASPAALVSTTRSTSPVGVAHDAAVAGRVVEHVGRHRRGRAGGVVRGERARRSPAAVISGTSPLRTSTGRRRGSRRAAARDRAAGAVGLLLDGDRDVLGQAPVERAVGPVDDDDRRPLRPRAPRPTGHAIIGRPQRSCSTLGTRERMRVPWPAARMTTVGAVTGRIVRAGRAGGQGFEPRLTAPKAVVLPLHHPPKGPQQAIADRRDYRRVADCRALGPVLGRVGRRAGARGRPRRTRRRPPPRRGTRRARASGPPSSRRARSGAPRPARSPRPRRRRPPRRDAWPRGASRASHSCARCTRCERRRARQRGRRSTELGDERRRRQRVERERAGVRRAGEAPLVADHRDRQLTLGGGARTAARAVRRRARSAPGRLARARRGTGGASCAGADDQLDAVAEVGERASAWAGTAQGRRAPRARPARRVRRAPPAPLPARIRLERTGRERAPRPSAARSRAAHGAVAGRRRRRRRHRARRHAARASASSTTAAGPRSARRYAHCHVIAEPDRRERGGVDRGERARERRRRSARC